MKRLFELAISSRLKDFFSVIGGTHNDTWQIAGMEYYRRLKAFAKAASTETSKTGTAAAEVEEVCETDSNVAGDADMYLEEENIIPTMGSDFIVRRSK